MLKSKFKFEKFRIKPAVLRQATYGTLKIGLYQELKQFYPHDEHSN